MVFWARMCAWADHAIDGCADYVRVRDIHDWALMKAAEIDKKKAGKK